MSAFHTLLITLSIAIPLPAQAEPAPLFSLPQPSASAHQSGTEQSGTAAAVAKPEPPVEELTGPVKPRERDGAPLPEEAEVAPDVEDRLVILPEIQRQGERHFLSSFRLPEKLTFANQPVPLESWQVRERIEYEFYQFLAEEGESIIMAKRTGRCFPPVEKQLAEASLPDDLKYMLLVESKCIAAAFSKAKASGPWQFIGSTGKRYQLRTNQWRDDRRNLEMSTEAAIKYLKYLKEYFGDWFLAMAAYNTGEERIKKLLKEQRVSDYWKLHYVRETMRYIPRIIAAKEIYSQPEKYLGLTKKDLYAPLETQTVTVSVREPQRHLASIAEEFGTYFLELKMLNPEIRKEYLPKGVHQIRVPKQSCPLRCFKQDKTP